MVWAARPTRAPGLPTDVDQSKKRKKVGGVAAWPGLARTNRPEQGRGEDESQAPGGGKGRSEGQPLIGQSGLFAIERRNFLSAAALPFEVETRLAGMKGVSCNLIGSQVGPRGTDGLHCFHPPSSPLAPLVSPRRKYR